LDLFGKHECQFRERKTRKEERHTFHSGYNTLAELFPSNAMFKTPESSAEEDCTAAEDSMSCKTAEEAIGCMTAKDSMGCKTAKEAMGCMTAKDSMGSTAAEDLTEESSEVVPFEIS